MQERVLEHRQKLLYDSDKKCVGATLGMSLENCDPGFLEEKIAEYAQQRGKRVDGFMQHIRRKYRLYLERACPHVV